MSTTRAGLLRREQLSDDVCLLTFAAESGRFRGCEPGAHVSVHLGPDLVRSYSLTHWTPDGAELTVAVKAERDGRGGSLAMHRLVPGAIVELSGPRNNFPVATPEATPIVLLAGGIGVTPLYAIARSLTAAGRGFELHYLTRSASEAAFDRLLGDLGLAERYLPHHDDTDGLLDLVALLGRQPAETHYYVCGPEPMLAAVQEASSTLGRGVVHFERFTAVEIDSAAPQTGFVVALASTGEEHQIPEDRSILQVLRDAGHDIDYACSEGTCGTCITDVLEGEIDHRDSILTPEEQAEGDCMCLCVSRACSARLVLDL